MKYAWVLWVLAGCAGAAEADEPTAYADDPALTCDTRAAARAEVLARLDLDPAACHARDADTDLCPDRDGEPVFSITYAPTTCAGETQARVGGYGGQWVLVCSCAGCSHELGFDESVWPRPLKSDWRQSPVVALHDDGSGC